MTRASESWAVWLVIILFLVVCIGIFIWFAIDNNIPQGIRDPPPVQAAPVSPTTSQVAVTHPATIL